MTRAVLIALALGAACSYPPLDLTDGGSGSNHNHAMRDGGTTCGAPGDYGTVTASAQDAIYYAETSNTSAELDVAGVIKTGSPGDYFSFNLIAQTSQIPGNDIPNGPQTWPLSSTDLGNCGVCAAIFTAATDPNAQMFNFSTLYVATSGSLSYSSTNTNAIAMITNATFAEAVFTNPNGSDFTTQLVSGGCTTSVDSVSFNATVTNGN